MTFQLEFISEFSSTLICHRNVLEYVCVNCIHWFYVSSPGAEKSVHSSIFFLILHYILISVNYSVDLVTNPDFPLVCVISNDGKYLKKIVSKK